MALHKNITGDDIHVINTWVFDDAVERMAAVGFTLEDIGKVARQEDDNSFWVLLVDDPPFWQQFIGNEGIFYYWTYADTSERVSATGFFVDDIGRIAWQLDSDTFWMLKTHDPISWVQVGSSGGGSGTSGLYYMEAW